MKNISLILNGVLLIAVAVLYYLHFNRGTTSQASSQVSATIEPGELKVAYINSDTVLKYYDFFKVNRDILEAKSKKMDGDFKNRALSLQKDIASYQNNVGNLTINQAKAIEEDIGRKQQNLRMYQESLTTELGNDEGKLNRELYERVTKYLKEYGEENNIHMVIKFDQTSDLLFGNNALDITQDVITGLNKTYRDEKSTTKPVAKDTTASKK